MSLNPKKPPPQTTYNCVSRIFFTWITRLLVTGYRRPLTSEDLWQLAPVNTSAILAQRLTSKWGRLCKRTSTRDDKTENTRVDDVRTVENGAHGTPKEYVAVRDGSTSEKLPSLWGALFRAFGTYFTVHAIIFRVLTETFTLGSIVLMGHMIMFIQVRDDREWWGYTLVVLIFVGAIGRTFFLSHFWQCTLISGMRARTALMALIYRKALLLNPSGRKSTSTGEIVNLMSVDAKKIEDAAAFAHYTWVAPALCGVCVWLIWQELGPSTLAGLAVMLLLLPINAVLMRKMHFFQGTQMRLKDKRLKMLNEVLSGIKVLKLYAWEDSFRDNIESTRGKEIYQLRQVSYLNAAMYLFMYLNAFVVAIATFTAYTLSSDEHILTAKKAFVTLAYFNVINFPLTVAAMALANIIQAKVSMQRLRTFLLSDTIDPDSVRQEDKSENAINIEDGTFSWGSDDEAVLKNIDLAIPEGRLVAVVGRVGRGKSSLISAMLGEMNVVQGNVTRKGTVAYVPQEAWVQNATMRANILFSRENDDSMYNAVIKACQLGPDFKVLPAGDQTEIGEKGINLSGGQKQRVSLARAVYQKADIYLLDDPLSAVDAHVGRDIMTQVIGNSGLLKGKTRVLVTHSLAVLPEVDEVIVLEDGAISERGSYTELIERNGSFATFLATYLNELEQDEDELLPEEEKIKEDLKMPIIITTPDSAEQKTPGTLSAFRKARSQQSLNASKHNLSTCSRSLAGSRYSLNVAGKEELDKQEKKAGQFIIGREKEEVGTVKLSIIVHMIRVCRWLWVGLTLVFFVLFLVSKTAGDVWLSEWADDALKYGNDTEAARKQAHFRLAVFGGIGVAQVIFTIFQAFAIATAFLNASRHLHTNLLRSIMRAPMSFFDSTPLGRIVNRFTRDLDNVDTQLPMVGRTLLACMSRVLVTIVVVSYSTPIFLVAFVPLAIVYFFVQRFYVASSRQLQRIRAGLHSPVFAHFEESLNGVTSIRAYAQQDRFTDRIDELIDDLNASHYVVVVAERWLGMWSEMLGNVIVFFATLFVMTSRGSISPGLAGLSISYALQCTTNLNYAVLGTANMENQAVSVERLCEYAKCPHEAAHVVPDQRPPDQWPDEGRIQMSGYSTKYRPELEPVLKNVDMDINPGEKLGVVGRTGAGKSSLALTLFRIIEPTAGNIIIDGKDIVAMGLKDLRSRLTIIPQEPVMFSGHLRMNLDPFTQYSDDQVWNALEHAHLKDYVSGLPEGLQHPCEEGGANLSVGQRQLVCLARALLRNTKILVLDEATATVDLETDELIQTTIRTEFSQSTIVTIAHRLNTIMDYNRVLVLDHGEVSQLGSPEELLSQKDGLFYMMAKDSKLVS